LSVSVRDRRVGRDGMHEWQPGSVGVWIFPFAKPGGRQPSHGVPSVELALLSLERLGIVCQSARGTYSVNERARRRLAGEGPREGAGGTHGFDLAFISLRSRFPCSSLNSTRSNMSASRYGMHPENFKITRLRFWKGH